MSTVDKHKIAWITGAGKGIGRGLAMRLAHEGWFVCVTSRTAPELESLKELCPSGSVEPYLLDVTDREATERTIQEIEERYGSIDLAVLNAGSHSEVLAQTISVEPFRNLIETNYMSVVYGLCSLVPRFVQRKRGHIAVVASLAGYGGLPSAAAYGASKAAIINMCEALYPELRRSKVKLTLINPGFVKTPLSDKNAFPMPFLITVEKAVDYILRGISAEKFEVTFPFRFAFLMKIMGLLPYPVYFAITRWMLRS